MGSYSYKDARSVVPQYIIDRLTEQNPDYFDIDDAGYDGGLHDATSEYICDLNAQIKTVNNIKVPECGQNGSKCANNCYKCGQRDMLHTIKLLLEPLKE